MPIQRAGRAARVAVATAFGGGALVAAVLVAEGVVFDRVREAAGRERAAATAVANRLLAGAPTCGSSTRRASPAASKRRAATSRRSASWPYRKQDLARKVELALAAAA